METFRAPTLGFKEKEGRGFGKTKGERTTKVDIWMKTKFLAVGEACVAIF